MGIVAGLPEGGVDPLSAIREVLANPELFAARLAELEKAKAAADAAVALVGPASEIKAMHAEAKMRLENADVALAQGLAELKSAREKAAAVVAEAESTSADVLKAAADSSAAILAQARDEAAEMRKQAGDELAEAKRKNAEVKKISSQAIKREIEAQAALQEAHKAELAATEVREQYEKKLAAIKAAVG